MSTLRLFLFGAVAVAFLVFVFFPLWMKWAEWCGFGQGWPFRDKLQTLFGDTKKPKK